MQTLAEKTILVLDAEDLLVRSLEDYPVGMEPRISVAWTTSESEAAQTLLDRSVDLVIARTDLTKGIDGLSLLRRLRERDEHVRFVLVANEEHEEERIVALSLGCTLYLSKPFSYERFCGLVFNLLRPEQGFTGRIVGLRLEDIIQMFCYRKDNTLLTVFHGEHKGNVYIHDGGIVHAECDSLTGVDAFYEIMGWDGGGFLSQIVLSTPPATVFIDWQSLVMEGIRQKDEIRHALAPAAMEEHAPQAVAASAGNGNLLRLREAFPAAAVEAKRIMIVDDSRFIRKIVQEILESDPGLRVAGYATNGQEALDRIAELKPDLILLDWDMPVMKGSTALMHIMIKSPCPVVVLSGFVGGVGANPFDLLCLGGVDFLRKPQNNWRRDGRADDLVRRVKDAGEIKFDRIRRVRIPQLVTEPKPTHEPSALASLLAVFGSSSGGCTDLIRLVPMLPADLPAAVILLHDMQREAIGAFIDYLDRRSRIRVLGLEAGAPLLKGACYLHPATVQVSLSHTGKGLMAAFAGIGSMRDVREGLLTSAATVLGPRLVAVLLSGGNGGATGLAAVKKAGGVTLIQDPASSTDPRAAEAAMQEGVVDYRASADALPGMFENLIKLVARGNSFASRTGENA